MKGFAVTRSSEPALQGVALDVELVFADRNEKQRFVLVQEQGGWLVFSIGKADVQKPDFAYGTPVFGELGGPDSAAPASRPRVSPDEDIVEPTEMIALDSLDHLQEELLRPDLQRPALAYEGGHFFPKFRNIHLLDTLAQELQQPCSRERLLVAVVAGLAHARLQMAKIYLRMTGRVPNEIVPIPPFDPALPLPAENGVQLARKQVGQPIDAQAERDRLEQVPALGLEPARRVRVHLQFDFQRLARRKPAKQFIPGIDGEQLPIGVRLQEGRLDPGSCGLLSRLEIDFEPETADLSQQGIAKRAQREGRAGPQQ